MKHAVVNLTGAEIEQLAAYCQHWENGPGAGWYYGHRGQFYARHESLREKLTEAMNSLEKRSNP